MSDEFVAKKIIEGILFLSPAPLAIKDISSMTGFKPSLVSYCLKELVDDYETRGIQVKAVAGAFQMTTSHEIAPYIEKLAAFTKGVSLSPALLETLSIIAYKQPVTRGEIEKIRGVNVDGVINKLLDMKLICILGRADLPGKPVLFGTTKDFLRLFGLESLRELPDPEKIESISNESGESDKSDTQQE
ncbi:MAG: SMC-Scp complex subunit ScpB [Firmicutes bacterium]|nr:SMC-Scp complex subunit ScpB [Bacillota bacterium]